MQKQKQLESPKIYTACCWLSLVLFYLLTRNQFSHSEVNKNKEVQKTDVNTCQMFILAVPPELYTDSSPIYASWRRQRRTLSYNINTSSAVWLDEKRRAIIAFLNKDKGIWDSLLEKVRTHSPGPSYLCLTSNCQCYIWVYLNRLASESGAKWSQIKLIKVHSKIEIMFLLLTLMPFQSHMLLFSCYDNNIDGA